MQIEELLDFEGREELHGVMGDSENLHRLWGIRRGNVTLLLKRYGSFCFWTKLVLEKDAEEVYRISYERLFKGEKLLDVGIRREFFFGELLREYEGNQFSFIEYIEAMHDQQDFPNKEWLVAQGLEARFAEAYHEKAKRIFEE
jgi:hypothetical protein